MNVLLICNYREGVGGISGQVDILRHHLRADGHRADVFSTKGSILRRVLLFVRLLRVSGGYDVLHIHCCSGWGFLPAAMGVVAAKVRGRRSVVTYHGGEAATFFARRAHLVRTVLMRADSRIVLNAYLASVFGEYGIPCTVVPNVVEPVDGVAPCRTVIGPRYVCTRAFEPLYDLPTVVRAFAAVRRQRPAATLTLVGDGSQHQALRRLVAELGVGGVTFVGRVPNGRIYDELSHCDVMLSAALADNMPVSLLEAMQAGLLVVATAVGGVPCMVDDGRTGYLFTPGDEDRLASLMLQAVDDQQRSLSIIDQAYCALGQYRWEAVSKKIMQAYVHIA